MGELRAIQGGKSIKHSIEKSMSELSSLRDKKDFSSYYVDLPTDLGKLAKSVVRFNNKIIETSLVDYIRNQESVKIPTTYGESTFNENSEIIEAPTRPCDTSLSQCFRRCKNLLKVGLLDVSNVTTLNAIFSGCTNLQTIEGVDEWDVSKSKSLYYAFSNNKRLSSLNLSKWDVSSCTSFQYTFSGIAVDTLDLSDWKPNGYLDYMFYGATIKKLIISNWDLSGITQAKSMFRSFNTDLIDLRTWSAGQITKEKFEGAFQESSAKTIFLPDDFVAWNALFYKCSNLATIKIGEGDFVVESRTTDLSQLFYECFSLTNIDCSSWDCSNVTSVANMFRSIRDATFDVTGLVTSACTDISYVFYYCQRCTINGLDSWDTSNVTNFNRAFCDVTNTSVPFKKLDYTNAENLSYAFYEAKLDYSEGYGFELYAPKARLFEYWLCKTQITELTATIGSRPSLYRFCREASKLQKVTIKEPVTPTNLTEAFFKCTSLRSVNLDAIIVDDTLNDIPNAFYMTKLKEIRADWKSTIASSHTAFSQMSELETIYLPNISLAGNCMALINSSPKLKTITLKSINLATMKYSSVSQSGVFGNSSSLTHIECTITNIMSDRDVSVAYAPLDLSSARIIIDGLYDYTGGEEHTISFSETTLGLLEDEDFDAIFAKNWTVG